jgi:hypothetical protein
MSAPNYTICMHGLFRGMLRSWRQQLGMNAPTVQGINPALREAKGACGLRKAPIVLPLRGGALPD